MRKAGALSLTEVPRKTKAFTSLTALADYPPPQIVPCAVEVMSWCENNSVDYVFGLARSQRLRKIIGREMYEATQQWNRTGKPARVFTGFDTKKTKLAQRLQRSHRSSRALRKIELPLHSLHPGAVDK